MFLCSGFATVAVAGVFSPCIRIAQFFDKDAKESGLARHTGTCRALLQSFLNTFKVNVHTLWIELLVLCDSPWFARGVGRFVVNGWVSGCRS